MTFVKQDVTDAAQAMLRILQQVTGQDVTLNQLVDIFKGSKNRHIVECEFDKLPTYGTGFKYTRHDAERLAHMLVLEGVLKENPQETQHGNVVTHAVLGKKASEVLAGRMPLFLSMGDKPKVAKKDQPDGAPGKQAAAIVAALRQWREDRQLTRYDFTDDLIANIANLVCW